MLAKRPIVVHRCGILLFITTDFGLAIRQVPRTAGEAMSRRKSIVLFDGQCPFCIRSVSLLKRFDWLRRFAYWDCRDTKSLPLEGFDPHRLLEEMHIVGPDGKTIKSGYSAVGSHVGYHFSGPSFQYSFCRG
jgi:hypothetical protein